MSAQQINPIQAQAMVDSLMAQLSNATGTIASYAGTIAVQAAEIKSLRAQLEPPQPTE